MVDHFADGNLEVTATASGDALASRMPTFVQRSQAGTAAGGTTMAYHSLAVVGDLQIAAIATHVSVAVPTPPTGWTLLDSNNTSTHNRLTFMYRVLTTGLTTNISFTWQDNGGVELRTYRNAGLPSKVGQGTGLVSPSRTVGGLLVRYIGDAQANAGSAGTMSITPDASLLNSTGTRSFTWYGGVAAGDDPVIYGGTAPSRTHTSAGSTSQGRFPQYVDILIDRAPLTISGNLSVTANREVALAPMLLGAAGDIGITADLLSDSVRSGIMRAQLQVIDDTLEQAPTSVDIVVDAGTPEDDVRLSIDGTTILETTLDSSGGVGASLPVSETLGTAGSHTITLESLTAAPGYTTTATFTIASAPQAAPVIEPSADEPPVEVPGTVVPGTPVRRWAFQDPMPGGLGSYVFPNNPSTMSPPHYQKQFSQTHTTARSGQYHISEVADFGVDWQFGGVCLTQAHHDALLQWGDLNRRFYVIDHRGRAWTIAISNVDMVARRRQNLNGTLTDWVHDYTVSAVIYDQNWVSL